MSTLEGRKNGKIGEKRFLLDGVGMLGGAITDMVHSQAVEVPVHPEAIEETKLEVNKKCRGLQRWLA